MAASHPAKTRDPNHPAIYQIVSLERVLQTANLRCWREILHAARASLRSMSRLIAL